MILYFEKNFWRSSWNWQ